MLLLTLHQRIGIGIKPGELYVMNDKGSECEVAGYLIIKKEFK